jgi:hypothetical protein
MLVASTWVLVVGSYRADVEGERVIGGRTHWEAITAIAPVQGPDPHPWPRSLTVAGCVLILNGLYASPQKYPREGPSVAITPPGLRKKGPKILFFIFSL